MLRETNTVVPNRSYLLCATPRTGSTLLCDALLKAKRMGVPREYFEYLKETGLPRQPTQYFVPCEVKGWNVSRIEELLDFPKLRIDLSRVSVLQSRYNKYLSVVLRQGTTRNGIFGAKIMWGQLRDFLDLLTGNADLSSSQRVNCCLQSTFPNLRYIYVTRNDKLRQAVSLWKAIQTQQWRSDKEVPNSREWRHPIFDFEAIEYLRRWLIAHDDAWKAYFSAIHVKPLVLHYEDFAADLASALARIAELLTLKKGSVGHFSVPSMVRQSDGLSEDWIGKYLSQFDQSLGNSAP